MGREDVDRLNIVGDAGEKNMPEEEGGDGAESGKTSACKTGKRLKISSSSMPRPAQPADPSRLRVEDQLVEEATGHLKISESAPDQLDRVVERTDDHRRGEPHKGLGNIFL